MTWVRLDDGFADKPEMVKAGPLAFAVAIWSLSYCARHLTDGHVARASLRRCTFVADRSQLSRAIRRLLVAGFWVEAGDGFDIVDPFQYLQKAADVEEKRRQSAERQRRWYERKKEERNAVTNGVRPEVPNAPPDPTPTPKGVGGISARASRAGKSERADARTYEEYNRGS